MKFLDTVFDTYDAPRISGMVLWFNTANNFQGFQPIYKNKDAKDTEPFMHRVQDNVDGQGRVTFMFADDEYLIDLQGKRIMNIVRDLTLVTNKGKYEMPGDKGLRKFSFYPETHEEELNHDNVIIGFGGSYSNNFNKMYAYFIDLRALSLDQQSAYVKPDENTGPVEVAYETWACEPRTAKEVMWYQDNGIEHLCEATRDDKRTPW